MKSTVTKFTDHNLKLLYGNLLTHYKECIKDYNNDILATYNKMYLAVQYAVNYGSLSHLVYEEKQKVYASFNAIFYALPLYRKLSEIDKHTFSPIHPEPRPKTDYVINNYTNYNCNDSIFYNWMLLRAISSNFHHYPSTHPGCDYTGSKDDPHRHRDKKNRNESLAELMGLLILIALAAWAATLTLIALYYMFSEFLNSVERFYYNEGWLKAALMLASSTVFSAAAAVMSFSLGSAVLISLAIMAGLNPAAIVVTGTVLFAIMGGGLGCFAMSTFYNFINKQVNKDAMDPTDPLRFGLTAKEERHLIDTGLDPIKVKCALVALRAEIASLLESEKPIPSFLSRMFGEGAKVQECLQLSRQLRNGLIGRVEVGDLVFDCKTMVVPQPVLQPSSYNTHFRQQTKTNPFMPSAPPMEDLHNI
ncbi:hypothetical protein [Legionella sp.]|uniref:hypothetical protein n=1 Tax=Legionella sp. TaxID=459 RepID=UPI003C8EF4FA